MVITDKFIYFRLQKCGSRTLGEFFKKEFNSNSPVAGVHKPVRDILKEKNKKLFVASVRNPWDWYVSWYFFNKNDNNEATKGRFKSILKKDFKETLKFMLNKKVEMLDMVILISCIN